MQNYDTNVIEHVMTEVIAGVLEISTEAGVSFDDTNVDAVGPTFGAEITRAGLAAGIDALTIESTEKVAFGFEAYRVLTEDLQHGQDFDGVRAVNPFQ